MKTYFLAQLSSTHILLLPMSNLFLYYKIENDKKRSYLVTKFSFKEISLKSIEYFT